MTSSDNNHESIFRIDLEWTRNLKSIKFYNRVIGWQKRAIGAQIWLGSDEKYSSNALCGTVNSDLVQTFACDLPGRYIFMTLMNFMKLEAFGTCKNCPAHSISPISSSGITACRCSAGYTGADGGTCIQCKNNHYKAGLGPAPCTTCPTDTVSPAGSIINTICQCSAGYTGTATCAPCVAGSYKTAPGSHACSPCPTKSYNADTPELHTARTTCTACPTDSSPNADSSACVCNSGYTGTTVCTACAAGTYKTSATGCTPCAAGKYSPSAGANTVTTCLSCQTNSNSPAGSDTFLASLYNGGYGGTKLCEASPLGTHRPAPDSGARSAV